MCIKTVKNRNSVTIHTKSTVHPFAFKPHNLADKITSFVGCKSPTQTFSLHHVIQL